MGCVFQFFLLVVFFSVSEVSMLLWVAQHTSLLFTMLCCAFTGILGGYFVRQQGLKTLQRIQTSIGAGNLPADETVEALMLLIVGVLLCVPGFITDFLGFLIIIPFIRKIAASMVVKKLSAMINSGNVNFFYSGGNQSFNTNSSTPQSSETAPKNLETEQKIEDADIVE
jgi:UPF0716 protein FxsA